MEEPTEYVKLTEKEQYEIKLEAHNEFHKNKGFFFRSFEADLLTEIHNNEEEWKKNPYLAFSKFSASMKSEMLRAWSMDAPNRANND